MTDYTELSYLRQLARTKQAEIKVLNDFKAEIIALTFLIMEGKKTLVQAENALYEAIQKNDAQLNTLKDNGN